MLDSDLYRRFLRVATDLFCINIATLRETETSSHLSDSTHTNAIEMKGLFSKY